MTEFPAAHDFDRLARQIKAWGYELGFQQIGITGTELGPDETRLLNWLREGRHGEMEYMARHGTKRSRPADLVPGTIRIVSGRMDYQPAAAADADAVLGDPSKAKKELGWEPKTTLQELARLMLEADCKAVGVSLSKA